jgi:hypothetical protein
MACERADGRRVVAGLERELPSHGSSRERVQPACAKNGAWLVLPATLRDVRQVAVREVVTGVEGDRPPERRLRCGQSQSR